MHHRLTLYSHDVFCGWNGSRVHVSDGEYALQSPLWLSDSDGEYALEYASQNPLWLSEVNNCHETVILLSSDWISRTLSFTVNGIDFGIACHNIEFDQYSTVRIAIEGGSVTFVPLCD
jgi:hypothetical protein